MEARPAKESNDGLIAILKEKSDLAILQDQGWYRIPVISAPKRWPPLWIAFYQQKIFGDNAYCIRYFGQVKDITRARRREIFPNELPSQKSNKEYYLLHLAKLEERAVPIPSYRPRRLVFIPTTWAKFERAEQINDLFDDSPLEDQLWNELKRLTIDAERQWFVTLSDARYFLDFAFFCKQGRLNVETDGDAWHLDRERAPLDNARDNALHLNGWIVLRYNTHQIRESFQTECLRGIEAGINQLGGLSSDGLVPRVFYGKGKQSAQQLSLFDVDSANDYMESSESDD